MKDINPTQIIIIGAVVVFGVPIAAGIVMAHFFGFWYGVLVGGAIFLAVIAVAQRRLKR